MRAYVAMTANGWAVLLRDFGAVEAAVREWRRLSGLLPVTELRLSTGGREATVVVAHREGLTREMIEKEIAPPRPS